MSHVKIMLVALLIIFATNNSAILSASQTLPSMAITQADEKSNTEDSLVDESSDQTGQDQEGQTGSQEASIESSDSFNGFLPTRGSVMLDFVFLAMLLILPVLQFSIFQAQNKRFRFHRNIQIGTAIALLAAVVLFEVDMRFYTDWRKLAEPSAVYPWCTGLLYFHLCFAIPTPFIWGWVIYGAMRNLDSNFQGSYVIQHRIAGKIAAIMMYGTGLTGILFYVVAFVL